MYIAICLCCWLLTSEFACLIRSIFLARCVFFDCEQEMLLHVNSIVAWSILRFEHQNLWLARILFVQCLHRFLSDNYIRGSMFISCSQFLAESKINFENLLSCVLLCRNLTLHLINEQICTQPDAVSDATVPDKRGTSRFSSHHILFQ